LCPIAFHQFCVYWNQLALVTFYHRLFCQITSWALFHLPTPGGVHSLHTALQTHRVSASPFQTFNHRPVVSCHHSNKKLIVHQYKAAQGYLAIQSVHQTPELYFHNNNIPNQAVQEKSCHNRHQSARIGAEAVSITHSSHTGTAVVVKNSFTCTCSASAPVRSGHTSLGNL
jgi:hypothetical protein